MSFEGVNGEQERGHADARADADLPCIFLHAQAVHADEQGDVEDSQRENRGQDDGFEGVHVCVWV